MGHGFSTGGPPLDLGIQLRLPGLAQAPCLHQVFPQRLLASVS